MSFVDTLKVSESDVQELMYAFRSDMERKNKLVARIGELSEELDALNTTIDTDKESIQVLSSVQDSVTQNTSGFVLETLNTILHKLFPGYSCEFETSMHGNNPQLSLVLLNPDGIPHDLLYQTGNGLRRIIGFLMRMCIIEVSGKRKLMVMDETLSGLTPKSLEVVFDLMAVLALNGFQVLYIEHNVPAPIGFEWRVSAGSGGAGASLRLVSDGSGVSVESAVEELRESIVSRLPEVQAEDAELASVVADGDFSYE